MAGPEIIRVEATNQRVIAARAINCVATNAAIKPIRLTIAKNTVIAGAAAKDVFNPRQAVIAIRAG